MSELGDHITRELEKLTDLLQKKGSEGQFEAESMLLFGDLEAGQLLLRSLIRRQVAWREALKMSRN